MEGGRITVEGNAARYLGHMMVGGTIEVNGDAGIQLGDLTWYVIRTNGNELEETISGGKIYHRGKLIYPKEGGDDAR
jgi:glutamate synthase domain-containing protein 3